MALLGVTVAGLLLAGAPAAQAATPTWHHPHRVTRSSNIGLTDVSCPTRSWCQMFDDLGNASVLSRGHWHSRVPMPHRAAIGYIALSCAAAGWCVAVGFDGTNNNMYAAEYRRGLWGHLRLLARSRTSATEVIYAAPTDISCAAVDDCVVSAVIIDKSGGGGFDDGAIFTFNGSSWSAREDTGTSGFTSVSCASARFCMVTDGVDYALIGSPATGWHRAGNPPANALLEQLSCAAPRFCMASDGTDGEGVVVRWTGTRWRSTPALPAAPGAFAGPEDAAVVDCVSSHWCMAVSEDGRESIWNGSSWRHLVLADPDGNARLQANPTAISCPAAGTCELVDSAGYAVRYG